jgi:hypothetical protein
MSVVTKSGAKQNQRHKCVRIATDQHADGRENVLLTLQETSAVGCIVRYAPTSYSGAPHVELTEYGLPN